MSHKIVHSDGMMSSRCILEIPRARVFRCLLTSQLNDLRMRAYGIGDRRADTVCQMSLSLTLKFGRPSMHSVHTSDCCEVVRRGKGKEIIPRAFKVEELHGT